MARSIQEYVDELYGKGQGTLNQIHEQRKQSDQQLIDSVNAAIDRTTAASTKPYQTQIEQLPEAYQKQFDANAVQELVGRRKVEEAMANMGLTDSGLNRTQQTGSICAARQRGRGRPPGAAEKDPGIAGQNCPAY